MEPRFQTGRVTSRPRRLTVVAPDLTLPRNQCWTIIDFDDVKKSHITKSP